MRRVRLLVTLAATAASLGFAALEGCGSFDGSAPDVGATDAAGEAAVVPESGVPEAAPLDASAAHPPPRVIYARGYGSTGDAGSPVTVAPTGMVVDPSGGVILAGSYAGGPVDVGDHVLPAPQGGDAFLVQLDGSGSHVQSKVFGDGALQTGGDVAGSASKLFASFVFDGTIDFGGAMIASSGDGSNPNSVVARFEPQLQYGSFLGLTGHDTLRVTHLALGASDSVVVFGDWINAIVTGTGAAVSRNPLHPGLVIARILGGGMTDIVHTEYCPDSTSCAGNAVATNVAGEVLAGGGFAGTIGGVDGGAPITAATDEDAYLMKLDPALNPLWVVSFGGTGVQEVTAIAAVPKTSDFVVAGVFHGTFTPPGQSPIQATDGGSDMFVARVDGAGKVTWAKTFGGGGDDVVRGLAVDGDANVFLVGDFHGPNLTFGGDVLINADNQGRGTRDMFLAWLDGAGAHVYSAAYGSPGDESPSGVGIDGMGNIVVAGSFDQAIDFGAGLVRATGTSDMFVARLAR